MDPNDLPFPDRLNPEELAKLKAEHQHVFRRLFEVQWPPPPCRIPDNATAPWAVAAVDGHALRNVLRLDYGATGESSGVYQLPNGKIRRVYDAGGLRGIPPGTLFVFDALWRCPRWLDELQSAAACNGWEIKPLESARALGCDT